MDKDEENPCDNPGHNPGSNPGHITTDLCKAYRQTLHVEIKGIKSLIKLSVSIAATVISVIVILINVYTTGTP